MRLPVAGALAASGIAALGLCVAVSAASCSSTPVNVPVRTFERAKKMDVVCMHMTDGNGNYLPAVPLTQDNCAPVPTNVLGSTLPNHLYALVTQTTRGEVAVVDITSGTVVDEDRSTPGINFIPVGQNPTDVAVAPDGLLTFVSAAEVNKPAIYAIPNPRILGDSQFPTTFYTQPALTLPELPVCALPQPPIALAIVPRSTVSAPTDGGSDAGDDGGDAATDGGVTATSSYELLVLLAAGPTGAAKIITIDPEPFVRGLSLTDLGPDASLPPAGTTVGPGSLDPCPITSAVELSGAVPPSWTPGGTWSDGIDYIDADIDISSDLPWSGPGCSAPPGYLDGGNFDAALPPFPTIDGGSAGSGTSDGGDAGIPFVFAQTLAPQPTSLVFDDQAMALYVGDVALPIIHVVDMSKPGAPRELPPLLATSMTEPSRIVSIGGLAISPTTRDYKRYLYAIDAKDGSLIVYDVTDPNTTQRSPMQRPYSELSPNNPRDRIVLAAPVAAVAFVRNDWPLTEVNGVNVTTAKTGLLCNPNANAINASSLPNVRTDSDESLGAAYTANAPNQQVGVGPTRLRGVFGLATLSNGEMVTIDVDDWDSPCRRPEPLLARAMDCSNLNGGYLPVTSSAPDGGGSFQASSLEVTEQIPSGPNDVDPYHAPSTYDCRPGANGGSPISLEAFFPVAAPHRPRSEFYLRNDPSTGVHVPNLASAAQLNVLGTPENTMPDAGGVTPYMSPAFGFAFDPGSLSNPTDPNSSDRGNGAIVSPGIAFSWEDPTAYVDQNWAVTYEGTIPAYDGVAAFLSSPDGSYETITMSPPNSRFCSGGVEDFTIARSRVDAEVAALPTYNLTPLPETGEWTGDYVQLADDVLNQGDSYWSLPNDCWDPSLADPDARQSVCENTYGSLSESDGGVNTTPSLYRDFPILEAYDDHFVVGRFGYHDPSNPQVATRVVVSADPSNAATMKLMKCCFANKVTFHVRAGGEWVTLGSASGFLHHVVTDPSSQRCVESCDVHDVLLNGRAPDVPRDANGAAVTVIPRNSPLAMRNPMFAFSMASSPTPATDGGVLFHTGNQRDQQWTFSTGGSYAPQSTALYQSNTSASPQSMRFIESLGQVAVVDGASQGLMLISLQTLTFAEGPFF
jgi:hypothetical protein